MVQVRLNATVRNIHMDNGTEFVNQTLKTYYEDVRISHQTSVARTLRQNGVVKRWNWTYVEVAHTMLIFSKAPSYLWAEAEATTCYTQNRSLIRKGHNKTPYELLHYRKPDLKTRASILTLGTISSGLAQNPYPSTPYVPPTKKVWDNLFQPMFDEYFLPPSVLSRAPPAAFGDQIPIDTVGTPSSTLVDQDAPSASTLLTLEDSHEPVLHQDVEGQEPPNAQFNNPFTNIFNQEPSFEESTSSNPSQLVSIRKQLDAMWCYFDAFLTSVEPKNCKEALTESLWIESMQEEIHEFKRLQV
ncbi:putative ribonuclease H-like domain-containing protein [Tanacetum coccineum]